MMHGIDFTNFQHTLAGIGVLIVGTFHLLNALLKQTSEFAKGVLRAIRGVAKSFRQTKLELQRSNAQAKKRVANKSRKSGRGGRRRRSSGKGSKCGQRFENRWGEPHSETI